MRRLARHISSRLLPIVAACVINALPASAQDIARASFGDPTTRYDHGVLGDAVEWGSLTLGLADGTSRRIILPHALVFEDTSPRIVDLDGDGQPKVIVVESHQSKGARLAVYGASGRIAQTPFIGRKNRWLAPIGAADFTGNGRLEIAIVVTPHLSGSVQLLAYDNSGLTVIATAEGFTNHRIGDPEIAGGIRTCGPHPELILAQMPWQRSAPSQMVALQLDGKTLSPRSFDVPFTASNTAAAQACTLSPN
ncbi:FG-GAP repeat domain-containing protein [Sulfitobacter pontiacus]|uniref:FG-GAP repeat domain-containing protein n=1 Tax=Sulfitobacter pontiacus TaxID=60137 RepID=UPI0010523843|nr:VCBS repeat-containing protein [Sulfitobacter pontiacus]